MPRPKRGEVVEARSETPPAGSRRPIHDRGQGTDDRHAGSLWALIVVSAGLIRLAWAASLGPGHGRGIPLSVQHVQRDWSYFDHPPMLAMVESVGLGLTRGGIPRPWSPPRLGFILLFAGSTWLMSRLTSRFFGAWAGVGAAFALNVSAYHTAASSSVRPARWPAPVLLAPDARPTGRRLRRPGAAPGLAWGRAGLGRGDPEQVPRGLPAGRGPPVHPGRALRPSGIAPPRALPGGGGRPGGVLAGDRLERRARMGVVRCSRGRGRSRRSGFRPDTLAAAIGGQAAYLFPWIWLALVILLVRHLLRFRRGATPAGAVPGLPVGGPLVAFTAVACVRPVLPHWTLVGYLSLFPLLGRRGKAQFWDSPARMGRSAGDHGGGADRDRDWPWWWSSTGPGSSRGRAPAIKADPTVDMVGWDQVGDELRRRGLVDDPATFLFTRNWFTQRPSGLRHPRERVPVLCYNHKDARSFAFWSRPEDWVGRDGILVSFDEARVRARLLREVLRADRADRRSSRSSGRGSRSGPSGSSDASGRPWPFPFLPGVPDPARPRLADGGTPRGVPDDRRPGSGEPDRAGPPLPRIGYNAGGRRDDRAGEIRAR